MSNPKIETQSSPSQENPGQQLEPRKKVVVKTELELETAGLSKREIQAYEYFKTYRGNARSQNADPSKFPLSMTVQTQLFQLYLNGSTVSEIHKLNPQFSLGQIAAACIDGDWLRHRKDHIETTFIRARERAAQAIDEGVEFVVDMMAATKRLHTDNLKKFLQTGNVDDLGNTLSEIGGIKQYKEMIDLLSKLTGGENKPQRVILEDKRSTVAKAVDDSQHDILIMARNKKEAKKLAD